MRILYTVYTEIQFHSTCVHIKQRWFEEGVEFRKKSVDSISLSVLGLFLRKIVHGHICIVLNVKDRF